MTRWNDAVRASFELLSQAPALRQGQELGQTEIQPPVPAATRSVRKNQMKRGSEEGDEDKEAKKPKEMAAPAPAPAPKEEEKDEAPVCNVGNLLEICDQDVDFAVELVGEGGQEMTGHAAKAVSRATSMDDAWLRAVRKSDFKRLQFLVCRGLREVLLSGYGRVYLSEIVSEFEPKTWPRCREQPVSLVDSPQAHRDQDACPQY